MINQYINLANEIININKGNLRTKRKCLTLNFLKTYHASVIENRPLLKFKFVFRSRNKRRRKKVLFFKRRYFFLRKRKLLKKSSLSLRRLFLNSKQQMSKGVKVLNSKNLINSDLINSLKKIYK